MQVQENLQYTQAFFDQAWTSLHQKLEVVQLFLFAVHQQQYQLIFTGKEAIDTNNGVLGGMLAELYPAEYVSLATQLELGSEGCTVTREIEGGEETLTCPLPAVISCQKGMADQRIPNMRGIMGARTKPLHVITPEAVTPLTSIVQYELPAPKAGVKLVSADQPEELIRLLHEEAKVL